MINTDRLIEDLAKVREKSPLVHNITNYVVMNNTANALLAIGASPVMAHAVEEVADMAAIASALVLNIGTLEPSWVKAMVIAAESAHRAGIPVVFDPVGAGATPYRSDTSAMMLRECRPSVIRGNASEIMSLLNASAKTKGVDSTASSDSAVASAQALAKDTGAVVVISGAVDYVTDGSRTGEVRNGSPLMSRVTGMGCTATAVVGAFSAVNPDLFEASLHAMAVMGIAGEAAASGAEGPGSLQMRFLDALYNLDETVIRQYIS